MKSVALHEIWNLLVAAQRLVADAAAAPDEAAMHKLLQRSATHAEAARKAAARTADDPSLLASSFAAENREDSTVDPETLIP